MYSQTYSYKLNSFFFSSLKTMSSQQPEFIEQLFNFLLSVNPIDLNNCDNFTKAHFVADFSKETLDKLDLKALCEEC